MSDKVASIIAHFNDIKGDDNIDIGKTGYEGLLRDVSELLPQMAVRVSEEFQFQEEEVLNVEFLSNRGIKPRDIIELMVPDELKGFCGAMGISTRGFEVLNILEHYKDADNLMLENYDLLAKRDLNGLKELGVALREADLGNKFEEVTKQLMLDLGLQVDEELRRSVNTAKDKADILVRGRIRLGLHDGAHSDVCSKKGLGLDGRFHGAGFL